MRLLRFVLGLAFILSIGGGLVAAQEDESFDGVWWNDLLGVVVEIDGTTVTVWQAEGNTCYLNGQLDLDGSRLLSEGIEVYTLELDEGALVILEQGSPLISLTTAESREDICTETAEMTLDLPDTPITTQAEFDGLVNEILAQAHIPGVGLALVAPGKVLWTGGYGFSNVEAGIPVTSDTPFMLASVTKTFTGTAVMRAVQEGKLTLDTPINDVLPFVVDNPHVDGEVITVRHLVTHTSGILDAYPTYTDLYTPGDSPIELGEFLAGYLVEGGQWYSPDDNFALRTPGVTSEYSNVGAALAGYIVQQVTNMPLDDYAQDFLFGPLGMTHTGWHLADFADLSPIAVPYSDGEPMEHFGYPTWPDGQLRTSPSDIARFLAAIMNGGELDGVRILDEATVETMLQPALPEVTSDIGVFWFLNYPEPGDIGHSGGDPGVTTWMAFNPEAELGVVVLFNCDCALAQNAMEALASIMTTHVDLLTAQ
ncbi:MAG: beta-lactamase family protein [Anaerolineae bacterium]|nr:beta-lactamase family protein [Anaerolineae bacterium]